MAQKVIENSNNFCRPITAKIPVFPSFHVNNYLKIIQVAAVKLHQLLSNLKHRLSHENNINDAGSEPAQTIVYHIAAPAQRIFIPLAHSERDSAATTARSRSKQFLYNPRASKTATRRPELQK